MVISQELIHESRIVPLDGRPPLSPAIRQWMGESRGRWEGETLVVETTNFTNMFLRRGESIQAHTSEPMRVPDWFSKDCAESIQSTEGQHDHFW